MLLLQSETNAPVTGLKNEPSTAGFNFDDFAKKDLTRPASITKYFLRVHQVQSVTIYRAHFQVSKVLSVIL
jgi:hypothetical protein